MFTPAAEKYLTFKTAIAQAIANYRNQFSANTLPDYTKIFIDSVEAFLNAEQKAKALWNSLHTFLSKYSWTDFYWGSQSAFLRELRAAQNQMSEKDLLQYDCEKEEQKNIKLTALNDHLTKQSAELREQLSHCEEHIFMQSARLTEQERMIEAQQTFMDEAITARAVSSDSPFEKELAKRLETQQQTIRRMQLDSEALITKLEQLNTLNQVLEKQNDQLEKTNQELTEKLDQRDKDVSSAMSDIVWLKQQVLLLIKNQQTHHRPSSPFFKNSKLGDSYSSTPLDKTPLHEYLSSAHGNQVIHQSPNYNQF